MVEMKKIFILVLLLLFIINLNLVSSDSIDSEIQKITNYAEDFESGNINYVQLLIYSSAVREEINRVLGATNKEMGGILKEEQLKSILGEPTEKTKWVWVENEEREMKLDKEVPAWRKIIFDGKKIQIWINSWPSIFKKAQEDKLIYRLNFDINFKESQEELNIESKIFEIKTLAENFNKEPGKENAEILAKESVNVEKTFERSMRQSSKKCEDTMKSIFGAENRRESQKMLVQEITFYEGKNFDVITRIEMCDECEWKWINLNMWINGRGAGFKMPEQQQEFSPEQFQNLDLSEYKKQISGILDEAKSSLEQGNYEKISSLNNKMQAINEAWNQKSNNVWPEVDKMFQSFETLTPEQQSKLENYWWIKQEQQKREKVKEIVNENYQDRKEFYLNLFSDYEKKEFYFSQVEYEKRLVEEFKEFGEEACDNNLDDNKNEKIDCSDEQCLGKRCGRQKVLIQKENETVEEERDLFCVEGSCQLREEIIQEERSICGNHICEGNETIENCAEDCILCPEHAPIECKGQVIFKGIDEKNCSLEPICLEQTETCETTDNCIQPLCGIAECIEGKCQTTTLEECKEPECIEQQEKIQHCESGEELVVERCVNGLWMNTGIQCTIEEKPPEEISCEKSCINQPHITCVGDWKISGTYPNCNCDFICSKEEQIVGKECTVREDCGGENDVCSNGRCETIPELISVQESANELVPIPTPEPTSEPSSEPLPEPSTEQQSSGSKFSPEPEPEPVSEPTIIGEVIKTIKMITGAIITAFQTEGETGNEETSSIESIPESEPSQEIEKPLIEEINPTEPSQEFPIQEPKEDEREERDDGERERNEREQKERCEKDCERPCVEKCIRESCGEKMECNVDEESKKCEQDCKPDDSCVGKCMQGGDWWKEFEQKDEHKEEKGVFKAGGMCRTAQGNQKTEAFIFFDGWGEPFKQIQPLKQKYYSGGNADWCKEELENLLKQRKELEQGLNQDFAAWFFEKYLANSADEWEQHVSGIFELYWKDVDLSRQIAERMNCLDMSEMPQYNLINIKYETDYGKLEFWEEIKTVKLPGFEKEMQVVSPYMKVWIFPPKSFIIYEMKQSMKNHKFPGPPEQELERENEEGPTAEEREMIKQDEKFMKQIREISEKYGGSLDAVIRFVDNGAVVFNLYAQVNENDIMKVKPMLPEEVPQEDVRVEIEFQKIYDMIQIQEKDMQGERIESPPWDRKAQPIQKIKEVVNGVKIYFKVRDMMNSAKIYPKTSEKDVKELMNLFFSMMMNEKGKPEMETEMKNEDIGEEKGVWDKKEKITGEFIVGKII